MYVASSMQEKIIIIGSSWTPDMQERAAPSEG